jgi:hypothetical protein
VAGYDSVTAKSLSFMPKRGTQRQRVRLTAGTKPDANSAEIRLRRVTLI